MSVNIYINMLDKDTTDKLYDFVLNEPKTIQEISQFLGKSWLTASRYVEKLVPQGVIGMRTFRGGTQGALKIVYTKSRLQNLSATQSYIRERISGGTKKADFSPSEIFQFAQKKEAFTIPTHDYTQNFANMKKHFLSAQSEMLVFSGNLSFLYASDGEQKILDVFAQLAKRGVTIKILCRVEMHGLDILNQLLAINTQLGVDRIFVRHAYHPLRADIIDNRMISCAETLRGTGFGEDEQSKDISIIYKIYDEQWISFISRLFWEYYSGAISAQERIALFTKLRESTQYP